MQANTMAVDLFDLLHDWHCSKISLIIFFSYRYFLYVLWWSQSVLLQCQPRRSRRSKWSPCLVLEGLGILIIQKLFLKENKKNELNKYIILCFLSTAISYWTIQLIWENITFGLHLCLICVVIDICWFQSPWGFNFEVQKFWSTYFSLCKIIHWKKFKLTYNKLACVGPQQSGGNGRTQVE